MAEEFPSRGSCFVMMPFAKDFNATYQVIRNAVSECRLRYVRADEISGAGSFVEDIHAGIENATVCVADITGGNPNVLAEFGYAQAERKPVILIYRGELHDLPSDIRHLRVIPYTATDEGHQVLRQALIKSLRATLGSPRGVLKEMLIPASLSSRERNQDRFVVAASPLAYREAVRSRGGFKKLRRTSADHVGIRGLIQAFGLIYGLDRLPDLVNPGDYIDDVVKSPAHFYCIGSPKANRWTGLLLKEFYEGWGPSHFEFKADPRSKDLRNVRVMVEQDGVHYQPPGFVDKDRRLRDFGFVIRGPHPFEPQYMLMILAGRSALGTEAACLAATDPQYVSQIKEHAERQAKEQDREFDFNDHGDAFWAAVHMRAKGGEEQYEAILESLTIAWAEPFRAGRRS